MGKMRFAVLSLFLLSLVSCSVVMATSGEKDPDLTQVRVGAKRGEVELALGPPVDSEEIRGGRVDKYEYEVADESSAGRAVAHGVMDLITLGLWEFVGTPIEAVQGEDWVIYIRYDENDVVVDLKREEQ